VSLNPKLTGILAEGIFLINGRSSLPLTPSVNPKISLTLREAVPYSGGNFWIQYPKKGIGMEKLLPGIRVPRRRVLREEAYKALRKAILRGEAKPGQRLKEERLASEIGTSRTPVREAFHKLEQEELVTRLARGGFVVREWSRSDVEEIFGIRSVLESYAAILATERIDEAKLAMLEGKLRESEGYLKRGETEKLIQLNTEFHDILYKSSNSRKLYHMINNLRDYFYRYRVAILGVNGIPQISLRDHKEMLAAMKKKDSALVEKLVREHILRGKEIVLREFEKGTV
jgi:DNA-binding GntR family transcriptional regulator